MQIRGMVAGTVSAVVAGGIAVVSVANADDRAPEPVPVVRVVADKQPAPTPVATPEPVVTATPAPVVEEAPVTAVPEPAPAAEDPAPQPATPAPEPAVPGQLAPEGYTGPTVNGLIPGADGTAIEGQDGYSDEFGVWHPAP